MPRSSSGQRNHGEHRRSDAFAVFDVVEVVVRRGHCDADHEPQEAEQADAGSSERHASSLPVGAFRKPLEVAPEPLEDDLEPRDAVERRAGARELVALGREAHELHLAPQQPQDREEVLGLLDVAAEVVLRVEDEQRRGDVLSRTSSATGRGTAPRPRRARRRVRPVEPAEVATTRTRRACCSRRARSRPALKRSVWLTIQDVM